MNILGVNAAGILGKIDSFENWLKVKMPAIFSIQETKVSRKGLIQCESTNTFQLYEQIRLVNPGAGGGLCVAVAQELPSALLREGGDEVECISVQVQVGQQSLVFVCGYGPQLSASPARKEQFWDYLEREVQEAAREEKMIVIQMDANSWLGGNFIQGDPNKQTNGNGKLFRDFLQRNNNIKLVNAMSLCEGVITRQ